MTFKRPLIRGGVYFALVFGVGFVLGVIRTIWLAPQLGERLAELLEAPLMLVAIWLSARYVTRRFPARRPEAYLLSGAVALVCLLSVEFTVVLGLRGLSVDEYFAARDPVAGGVYVFMLIIFAVMPWVIGNHRLSHPK